MAEYPIGLTDEQLRDPHHVLRYAFIHSRDEKVRVLAAAALLLNETIQTTKK